MLGHDTGLIVFKLERERPAHAVHQNMLYYVKDKFLRSYDFTSANDVPVLTIRRGATPHASPPRALSYNPAEHCVLITSPQDGGTYELYSLPKGQGTGDAAESKRGAGNSAVFVARNRFAVLDKPGQVFSIALICYSSVLIVSSRYSKSTLRTLKTRPSSSSNRA